MPKRSSTSSSDTPTSDPATAAYQAIRHLTRQKGGEPPPLSPAARSAIAALLGSRGGKKGGKARAESLSPERRAEIAKKAADARWSNKPHPDTEG